MTSRNESAHAHEQAFETEQTVERRHHLALVAAEVLVAEDYFNDLSGDEQIAFGD